MANVNELGLTSEDLGLDYDNIPEERAEFVAPLQPGAYLFQLPADLSNVWKVIERQDKQRVQAVFHGEDALTAFLPKNEERPFSAWIDNHSFPRGTEKIEVSDMQYLLRVLDPSASPKTNPEFVSELNSHAGEKFKATVNWTSYCNPNKPAYFENAEGVVEETAEAGCDTNYYQNNIPRDEKGAYETQFECTGCHAVIRAFPKLRNFQSVD